MLKCIVIDDEPLAVKLLSDYVAKCEFTALAAAYNNPIEALKNLEHLQFDLIFLDVQMPELSGVQFAKIVQGKYPVIITTAYEEYALEGYQLDLIDYLLKPISFARFLAAIDRARIRNTSESLPEKETDINSSLAHIFVKSGYKTQRIDLDDILYVEGLSDYIRIHTSNGAILTLDTLKRFEASLPIDRFIRIHKSYIIALDKLNFIENNRIVIGEKRIPIGGTYQDKFWKRINKRV
jgi:DNA-binding LytR/AlgR family response regulator